MTKASYCGSIVLLALLWGSQYARSSDGPSEAGAAVTEPDRASAEASASSAPAPQTTTAVTFDEDVAGEIFIRDADGLVVRLFKSPGRRRTVRLAPGRYEITCQTELEELLTAVDLVEGERIVLGLAGLRAGRRVQAAEAAPPGPRRARACEKHPGGDVRAWRLTFDSGFWAAGGSTDWSAEITDHGFRSENGALLGGISVGHRINAEWMVGFTIVNRLMEASDGHDVLGADYDHASMITSFLVGARYYLPPLSTRSAIKPYLSAAIGPSVNLDVESWHNRLARHHDEANVRSEAVFGGMVGGGVDLQATSWLVFGTDLSYHIAPKFSEDVVGHRDPSGLAFGFQMGVTLGRRVRASSAR